MLNFAGLMRAIIRSILFFTVVLPLMAEAQTITVKQYIDSFKTIAMKEMIEFKIPASITLAQGLLESGSGNSRLARQGNNHFGIKCKKDWTGCTILEDDDALQECFRCYEKAEDSYRDHSRFLRDNKRYAALFTYRIDDYRAWAKGLLAAGYATNQKYADLLIGTIERNRLMRFDSMVLSGYDPFQNQIQPNIDIVYNKVPSTVVGLNQSIETIAEQNNKTPKRLAKFNDLDEHKQIAPGDVLYLKPKKRKASVASHQVQSGETMWEISQKYAIRINSLYKKNLMDPGTEPKPGVVLHLQEKAAGRPDTGRTENMPQRQEVLAGAKLHKVQAGETLYSISKKYGLSIETIKSLNGLQSDQLTPGQTLKLGSSGQTQIKEMKTHTVQAGETLYSISRKYQVSVEDIKAWNKLSEDSLRIGQILEIR